MSPTNSEAPTTTAVVLHGPKDLRIEQTPLLPPPPGHLQISIHSTTLCGSDLHYYNHFANGSIICHHPLALGHESSGTVTALPASYTGTFQLGDRVALEVGLPCGSCELCTSDRYNICPSLRFRSSAKSNPHWWGTLQEKLNHPEEWCHKLNSENVGFTEAALMEPLAVAVHANRRSGGVEGKKVLVIGAGAVGLLVAAVATAGGAEAVVITDLNPRRIEFGVGRGWATKGLTVEPSRTPEDNVAGLKALLLLPDQPSGLEGFDTVFECSGAAPSVRTAILATKPGGTVVLIGMGTPEMMLPISAAALREVDLKGSFRYGPGCYRQAMKLLEEGRLKRIGELVTQRFYGVEGVRGAFETAGKGEVQDGGLVVKVECVFGEKSR